MVIAWARIGLRNPAIRSLKEKRHALRGTMEKLGRAKSIAVSEVGDHDMWGNADIAVAVVAESTGHAETTLQGAISTFEEDPIWEVVSLERGLERLG
jgi:uncharacterized protein YlxP (DUF503 family)